MFGLNIGYGKLHRYALRYIASQGVLSLADISHIIEKFAENEQINVQGSVNVQDIVKEINDVIRPYQQQIKITNDEVTDQEVVVFMSLGYDATTKSQNVFSPNELEFFRLLIEQIMTTESRQITGISALNLVGKMKAAFTKTDAEKILITWCRMRYLDKVENNFALGVRAIHEFEGYLRQNMPDTIHECCLCKQIVFRGYNCPGCDMAVHTRCLKRYLEKVEKWPCCKIDFHQDQLERLNNDSSRFTQTQQFDTTQVTQQSVEYNTIVEPVANQDSSGDMEITQESIPETSQRVNRKRKRQIE